MLIESKNVVDGLARIFHHSITIFSFLQFGFTIRFHRIHNSVSPFHRFHNSGNQKTVGFLIAQGSQLTWKTTNGNIRKLLRIWIYDSYNTLCRANIESSLGTNPAEMPASTTINRCSLETIFFNLKFLLSD